MKRVIISLLLLAPVFLMSGLFTPETIYSAKPAPYPSSLNEATNPQPFAGDFLHPGDCDCDASGHPTPALILLAALASSLTMAAFIYGSHFIVVQKSFYPKVENEI